MDNLLIFNLQNLAAFVAFYLLFRWWVKPRLDRMEQYQALLPVVFYHAIRFMGMMFMVDGQFYDAFPKEDALVIGLGDFIVSILAMVSCVALRTNIKVAIPLVWFTVIFGLVDMLNAFRLVGAQEVWNQDIEGVWYLMVLTGAPAIITSVYIIYRLIRPQPKKWHLPNVEPAG